MGSILFEPISIAGMELKNRIVMPAIGTGFCKFQTGEVTDQLKEWYRERAMGGVGLITVGVASVKEGVPFGVAVYNDYVIDGVKEVVAIIHEHDAKASVQLWHPGRYEFPLIGKDQPVSASDVPAPLFSKRTPMPLTVDEIHEYEQLFIDAAVRCKKAGFDAAEIIGSAGYLISQFLSPSTNRRNDEYGGSLENRVRFPVEIINGMRKALGDNYPILCRISGDEFVEGGNTLEDMKEIARHLEDAGADAMNVTAGWHESKKPLITMDVPRGGYVYLAEGIKSVVNIPIIASNRINDPLLAERILEEGRADLISMARPLIADPELPRKAMEGRYDEIRTCIACNQGCLDNVFRGKQVTCLFNPAAGKEAEYRIKQAEEARRIVVAGGGPAGCEFARVAALRGHTVVLFERNGVLGGQINIAAASPHSEEFANIPRYYKAVLSKDDNVTLRMNTEATPELIMNEGPDVVVLATGAVPVIPPINGVDRPDVVTAFDVLSGKAATGDNVIIIGGGGVGCSVGKFLGSKGKNVTILEMQERIGADIGISMKWPTIKALKEYGVNVISSTKVAGIGDEGVITQPAHEIHPMVLATDTVVLAVGTESDNKLEAEMKSAGVELHVIGDCRKPKKALDAISAGARLARKI